MEEKCPHCGATPPCAEQIAALREENKQLKAKATRLERRWAEHQAIVKEIRAMRDKFKAVVSEFADHNDCI